MKRPAKEVIKELAVKHGLTKDDGSVNMSAFSRRTDIPVATIANILNKEDHWRVNYATVSKLVSAFGISHEQASGEAPLEESEQEKIKPYAKELELIRKLRALDSRDREDIEAMVDMKSKRHA